ncbi:hypothetical protein BC833DRAFT_597858 [Globomyces pollinis-pini]|nr:hypothetical protein BC833DRAFT_597858 [Globomyces pollinis-pini]
MNWRLPIILILSLVNACTNDTECPNGKCVFGLCTPNIGGAATVTTRSFTTSPALQTGGATVSCNTTVSTSCPLGQVCSNGICQNPDKAVSNFFEEYKYYLIGGVLLFLLAIFLCCCGGCCCCNLLCCAAKTTGKAGAAAGRVTGNAISGGASLATGGGSSRPQNNNYQPQPAYQPQPPPQTNYQPAQTNYQPPPKKEFVPPPKASGPAPLPVNYRPPPTTNQFHVEEKIEMIPIQANPKQQYATYETTSTPQNVKPVQATRKEAAYGPDTYHPTAAEDSQFKVPRPFDDSQSTKQYQPPRPFDEPSSAPVGNTERFQAPRPSNEPYSASPRDRYNPQPYGAPNDNYYDNRPYPSPNRNYGDQYDPGYNGAGGYSPQAGYANGYDQYDPRYSHDVNDTNANYYTQGNYNENGYANKPVDGRYDNINDSRYDQGGYNVQNYYDNNAADSPRYNDRQVLSSKGSQNRFDGDRYAPPLSSTGSQNRVQNNDPNYSSYQRSYGHQLSSKGSQGQLPVGQGVQANERSLSQSNSYSNLNPASNRNLERDSNLPPLDDPELFAKVEHDPTDTPVPFEYPTKKV